MGNIYIGKNIFKKILDFIYNENYFDNEAQRIEILAHEVTIGYYHELLTEGYLDF